MPDPKEGGLSPAELLELAHLGRSAEELLQEPIIERWFADLNRALLAELRNGTRDEAPHWHDMLDCADKLRDVLDTYIRRGQWSATQLRKRTAPPSPFTSRFKFQRSA